VAGAIFLTGMAEGAGLGRSMARCGLLTGRAQCSSSAAGKAASRDVRWDSLAGVCRLPNCLATWRYTKPLKPHGKF